jgi:hypothetical protein
MHMHHNVFREFVASQTAPFKRVVGHMNTALKVNITGVAPR